MSKILGISAKKQGGKNTSMNFIFGLVMGQLGMFNAFKIDEKGRLIIQVWDDEKDDWVDMGFDPLARGDEKWFEENLDPHIKAYSFADPLKRFCVDVMGLRPEQCYGTDDEKNTLTQYRWEDFMKLGCICPAESWDNEFLTGREVMQQFGTNVMRTLLQSIWVDATLRRIAEDQPGLAIICDVRFPDEADGIKQAGGKVMRLMRDPFKGQDQHPSETALDDYDGFDAMVDNADVSIAGNNELVLRTLIDFWGEEWQL